MKVFCSLAVIVLLNLYAVGQKSSVEDISLLKPRDAAYADAVNASAVFNEHGLKIQTIHRSKLESFFRGVPKAAVFKTENGAFEIIFFPEPNQAEKITVKKERAGRRYIYSFEGQPQPAPQHDVMNAAYPVRFIAKGDWFVVVSNNESLAKTLRKILL